MRSAIRQQRREKFERGFALVTTVLMLTLLTLLAVGLLGLSAVELRKSDAVGDLAVARSNARLALMSAIGQLQVEMGADQRVSAQAEMLGDTEDPHWTGVWSSIDRAGKSIWQRDPERGGWTDARSAGAWQRESEVRKWLVSGDGAPGGSGERVEVVGEGSVGPGKEVSVPLVDVGNSGRFGWWTGDLSVRANLAVADAHEGGGGEEPGPETYRRMVSQQAEEALMGGEIALGNELRRRLVTAGTVELSGSKDWAKRHFHDYTVRSRGVLADAR
ncbi:MAG: hypothetical protein ACPG4K_07065, partial [Haloferula sp.]